MQRVTGMNVVRSRFMPLMALLAAGACASAPVNFDDNLVVPGARVGEVQIGMPLAQLLTFMGTPRKSEPIPGTAATSYSFDGLTVGAHDTVYWIIADSPKYHTQNGVAPGSEQIFARAAFGKPDCVATRGDMTVYDYKDVYFEVDNRTGKVTQLGVQKKTTVCEK